MVSLTNREKEVIDLLCQGKENKVIAYELSMSSKSVKNYLTQLFKRYEVSNRTALALRMVKDGLNA
jgi:DNA-binding NarL/FixJ family response regulator